MDWLLSLLAEAAGEHAGGGAPELWPQIKHVAWSFVNFLALLWILNKFLYKPLLGMIDAREREVTENLEKAARDREEAERLRREFAEQVERAQQEAQNIIAEASRNAQTEADRILTEAREKAAQDLERAQQSIRVEKERALAELREEVADLAVAVAGKVIEKSLDDTDHARLAEKFVEEVGKN